MTAEQIARRDQIVACSLPEPLTGCWLWASGIDRYGYGKIAIAGATLKAHRVSYEIFIGEIPTGLMIDHKCRVRSCVNPDHLEPVTRRENTLRGETIPAANLAKTHCCHGHELSEANTRVNPKNGKRLCRACDVIRQVAYQARRRQS